MKKFITKILKIISKILPCFHEYERSLRKYSISVVEYYDEMWKCKKCGDIEYRNKREPWRDW